MAKSTKKSKVEEKDVKKATPKKAVPKKVEPKKAAPIKTTSKKNAPIKTPEPKIEDFSPPNEENMSAFQIKQRKQRTCTVENVPSKNSAKDLLKKLEKFGSVERIWF